jgi:hypothetical protein
MAEEDEQVLDYEDDEEVDVMEEELEHGDELEPGDVEDLLDGDGGEEYEPEADFEGDLEGEVHEQVQEQYVEEEAEDDGDDDVLQDLEKGWWLPKMLSVGRKIFISARPSSFAASQEDEASVDGKVKSDGKSGSKGKVIQLGGTNKVCGGRDSCALA